MITLLDSTPLVAMIFSAELLLLLTRSSRLTILLKSANQRLVAEQREVQRGLFRSIILEALIFVPASCVLLSLVAGPLLASRFKSLDTPDGRVAFQSALGIASYGFPFATLRLLIVKVAMNTLKEFAELSEAPKSREPS